MTKKFSRETRVFIVLLICVAVIELVCAGLFWGKFDLLTYNFPWSQVVVKNWAGMYRPRFQNAYLVNYPPLIPTLLWPFGKLIHHFGVALVGQSPLRTTLAFLLIKLLPLIFHWLTAIFVYWKSSDKLHGLWLSVLILVNPAIWFNAAFWGQMDSVLVFLIVISFYYLQQRQYLVATLWFSVGCLAKLQFIYLVPIFGLVLLTQLPRRLILGYVSLVIGVNIVSWLPFMINMHSVLLPFKVILGGANQYDGIVVNAFNFWSAALKARVWYKQLLITDHILGPVTYNMVGQAILVLIILGLIGLFWGMWRHRLPEIPLSVIGLIYTGAIFFFTMGQHERYQIPMLAFELLWLMSNRESMRLQSIKWAWFAGLTSMIFINEAFLYFAMYVNMNLVLCYRLIRLGGIINTLVFIGLLASLICQYRRPNQNGTD
ncbi:hypothetical protein [Furfurilactobacillus curtus]